MFDFKVGGVPFQHRPINVLESASRIKPMWHELEITEREGLAQLLFEDNERKNVLNLERQTDWFGYIWGWVLEFHPDWIDVVVKL